MELAKPETKKLGVPDYRINPGVPLARSAEWFEQIRVQEAHRARHEWHWPRYRTEAVPPKGNPPLMMGEVAVSTTTTLQIAS